MGVIRRVGLSSQLIRSGCSRRDQGRRKRTDSNNHNHHHHHHHHHHTYLLLRGNAASCQTAEGPWFACNAKLCVCVKMYVTACAYACVCVCVCASCCLNNSLPVWAHSLTIHSFFSSFTSPLCLPPSCISHCITPYIHEFPVYHENLCMKIEGVKGGKNKNNNKKTKQGECRWGFFLVWVQRCTGSPVLGGHMQEDSGSISLFFSFLFCLSFYPPTYRLPSLLPNIHPPLLIPPRLPTAFLFSSSSLLHSVKASYRQRSSPS